MAIEGIGSNRSGINTSHGSFGPHEGMRPELSPPATTPMPSLDGTSGRGASALAGWNGQDGMDFSGTSGANASMYKTNGASSAPDSAGSGRAGDALTVAKAVLDNILNVLPEGPARDAIKQVLGPAGGGTQVALGLAGIVEGTRLLKDGKITDGLGKIIDGVTTSGSGLFDLAAALAQNPEARKALENSRLPSAGLLLSGSLEAADGWYQGDTEKYLKGFARLSAGALQMNPSTIPLGKGLEAAVIVADKLGAFSALAGAVDEVRRAVSEAYDSVKGYRPGDPRTTPRIPSIGPGSGYR